MYDKLDKCPLCNSKRIKNFIICTDYFLSGESFAISQCEDCNLEFTNPRPGEEFLSNYYQSTDYISHSNKGNSLINRIYKLIRIYTINKKVKLINSYQPKKGNILDFGCGTGEFLYACKQSGWVINGIELEKTARDQAESIIERTIYRSLTNIPEENQFDAITLWHVLEHISDLNNFLKTLKKNLAPNGTLFVAVPNNKSWDAIHYKKYWAAYDVPRHFYHFNQTSFRNLCDKHALKLKSTIPMKFDSFYISLLSEKYKNGKTNYLRSIINGSLSNNYAKLHQNNYSSLIYILKK